jgi:riboflavin kinase/FMN adenylyltransferase
MQHYRSLNDVQLTDVWLTIGSFDGVHKGHQSIIKELTAGAQENCVPAVVLTFHPHPVAVLRGQNFPYYLSTLEDKAEIFDKLGVDVLITHPFNRNVANKTARQFIANLNNHLRIRHLQVGYDFAMGKNRDGDFPTLQKLGQEFGFSVKQSSPIEDKNGVISSSRIRFLLGVGQVNEAANLLGRNYKIQGLVEVGDQRGRTLGFPTANLAVWEERIIPTAGVYACRATVRGKTWGAVTNIGVRPTFEDSSIPPMVETHLIDFLDEIYGENIQLEFITRLRDEHRFPSIDDLVTQIRKDTEQARKILFA